MLTIVLAGLIFLIAGFVQGLIGFGAGLIAIPLLCLIVDLKLATPLVILNGFFLTSYLAVTLSKYLERGKILPLIIGSLPGTVLGAFSLKYINSELLKIVLGVILVAYSAYTLAVRPRPLRLHRCWGYMAGFLTGTITALVSAGGPPSIIYATLTDWNKNEIKATLTGFFVFNAFCAMIAHAATGMTTLLTLKYFCVTLPFVLVGTALGTRLTDRIDRNTYLKFVYFFLLIMGVIMIWG